MKGALATVYSTVDVDGSVEQKHGSQRLTRFVGWKAGCLISGRFSARAGLQKVLASQCPGPLSIWDAPLLTPAFRRRGVDDGFLVHFHDPSRL